MTVRLCFLTVIIRRICTEKYSASARALVKNKVCDKSVFLTLIAILYGLSAFVVTESGEWFADVVKVCVR